MNSSLGREELQEEDGYNHGARQYSALLARAER
jgi:hypothetical protein